MGGSHHNFPGRGTSPPIFPLGLVCILKWVTFEINLMFLTNFEKFRFDINLVYTPGALKLAQPAPRDTTPNCVARTLPFAYQSIN